MQPYLLEMTNIRITRDCNLDILESWRDPSLKCCLDAAGNFSSVCFIAMIYVYRSQISYPRRKK